MKYTIKSDKPYAIEIENAASFSDQFKIKVDGVFYHVQIKEFHPNGRIKTLVVNNEVIPVEVIKHADGSPRTIYLNGLPFDVETHKIKSLSQIATPAKQNICGDVKSGLPGQVLSVLVKIGDKVEKGQPLIVLESMKMENEIVSPKSGEVKEVFVTAGQVVVKDDIILKVS